MLGIEAIEGRKFDEDVLEQLGFCRIRPRIRLLEREGCRLRDEVFSSFRSSKRKETRWHRIGASSDREVLQLASDRTTILYSVRTGELARVGPAEVSMRCGIL